MVIIRYDWLVELPTYSTDLLEHFIRLITCAQRKEDLGAR